MIELVIVRAERGRYSAVLGERVLVTAKEPYFAAARILVAEGFDPDTVLTMRHQGSQTRSLTMPLGKAAGLMVEERDNRSPPQIVRWRGGLSTVVWGKDSSKRLEGSVGTPDVADAPVAATPPEIG